MIIKLRIHIYNLFNQKVFNDDTLYNAYDKRCKTMPFYKDIYEKQKENEEYKPKDELIQNLVDDLEKQFIFIK